MWISCAFCWLAAVLPTALSLIPRWETRKLDRLEAEAVVRRKVVDEEVRFTYIW
jgi:hypothetical protein